MRLKTLSSHTTRTLDVHITMRAGTCVVIACLPFVVAAFYTWLCFAYKWLVVMPICTSAWAADALQPRIGYRNPLMPLLTALIQACDRVRNAT